MGLDSWFVSRNDDQDTAFVIVEYRNHWALHNWIGHWCRAHGTIEDFLNSCPVQVTRELLETLAIYAAGGGDPYPDRTTSDPEKWAHTREILIPELLNRIQSGEHIYYDSWY